MSMADALKDEMKLLNNPIDMVFRYLYNQDHLWWFLDAAVEHEEQEDHHPNYIAEKMRVIERGPEAWYGALDAGRKVRWIEKMLQIGANGHRTQRERQRHDRYAKAIWPSLQKESQDDA